MVEFATREELIIRLRADFARLRAAVIGVDVEQTADPVAACWDVKDVLAHFEAWDRARTWRAPGAGQAVAKMRNAGSLHQPLDRGLDTVAQDPGRAQRRG